MVVKASLIAILLLAGCASVPIAVEDPREVWCDENRPRHPSLAVVEAMTRAELDDLNSFNGKGALWCGWTP